MTIAAYPGTIHFSGTPSVSDFQTYLSDASQWLKENQFNAASYGVAPIVARSTATVAAGTAWASASGGTVTLNQIGTWVIYGGWHMKTDNAAVTTIRGRVTVNGTALHGQAILSVAGTVRGTMQQPYYYTTSGTTDVAVLQFCRDAAGGGSIIGNFNATYLVAYCWQAGS